MIRVLLYEYGYYFSRDPNNVTCLLPRWTINAVDIATVHIVNISSTFMYTVNTLQLYKYVLIK